MAAGKRVTEPVPRISAVRAYGPLIAILSIAAVARFWAIDFCLPSPVCRPDEDAVASVATGFFARDFNPHFFDWPALFMYVVAAALIPVFKLGKFLGWFRGEYHFLQWIATDPTLLIMIARTLSASAGVASVWVLFDLTRRSFDRTSALIAASFLALAFLHVRDSHFGVTDVPATFFLLVAFLFITRLMKSGATRDLVLSAVAAGLAMSTKYNAAIVALPALWVLLARPTGRPALTGRFAACALFLATMLLTFAVTSPYSFLDHRAFTAALGNVSAHLATGHGVELGRGWLVHLSSSLRYGLGIPLLVAGLSGLVWLVVARPREGFVVAILPVTYYLVVGSGHTVFARYILPVIPFLCLTAALGVAVVSRWLAGRVHRPAAATAVAWTLAMAIVAPSLRSVVEFDRLLSLDDSRELAAAWIRHEFPRGVHLTQAGRHSTHLFFLPDAIGQAPRYTVVNLIDDGRPPDVLVVGEIPLELGVDDLARARPFMDRYTRIQVLEAYDPAATGNVYDWQDEFYLPLTGFSGIRRPGPNFTIYARPDLVRTAK